MDRENLKRALELLYCQLINALEEEKVAIGVVDEEKLSRTGDEIDKIINKIKSIPPAVIDEPGRTLRELSARAAAVRHENINFLKQKKDETGRELLNLSQRKKAFRAYDQDIPPEEIFINKDC